MTSLTSLSKADYSKPIVVLTRNQSTVRRSPGRRTRLEQHGRIIEVSRRPHIDVECIKLDSGLLDKSAWRELAELRKPPAIRALASLSSLDTRDEGGRELSRHQATIR